MSQEKQRKILMLFQWGMIATVAAGVGEALTHSWWMCFASICQVFALVMFRYAVIRAMQKQ